MRIAIRFNIFNAYNSNCYNKLLKLHCSPFYFWTAHKVTRANATLGRRYDPPLPVDNYIADNLYCIAAVYDEYENTLQWEPMDCTETMPFVCNPAVGKRKY